jgi:hypothetical protein
MHFEAANSSVSSNRQQFPATNSGSTAAANIDSSQLSTNHCERAATPQLCPADIFPLPIPATSARPLLCAISLL